MKNKAERIIELFSELLEKLYSKEKHACLDTPLCALSNNDLKVLLALESKNNPSIKEISEELSLPMSTLTGIFNKLVEKKLVERDRCESDRRIVRVNLSAEGLEAVNLKKKHSSDFAVGILSQLTENEQNQFISLLEKITLQ